MKIRRFATIYIGNPHAKKGSRRNLCEAIASRFFKEWGWGGGGWEGGGGWGWGWLGGGQGGDGGGVGGWGGRGWGGGGVEVWVVRLPQINVMIVLGINTMFKHMKIL